MNNTCTCGETKNHVIARRVLADETPVTVWCDGTLTMGRFGAYVHGLGTPRWVYRRESRRKAVRLMMDDFALYTIAELPRLIKIAQSTFAHTYAHDDFRRAHVRTLVAL